ncbi:hypothetical protein BH09BAC1_BH09BAC1_13310 [soil metagenome]
MLRTKNIYEQLETCTDDEIRLGLLFDLTVAFLNFDEKRSFEVADEIWALAEKMDCNKGRSYYHSARARVFYKKSKFAEATLEFNKALDKALLTSDLTLQAICLDSLGVVYNQANEYDKAIDASTKALETFKQIPNTVNYQIVCYNNIGNVHKRTCNYADAELVYLDALNLAIETNDTRLCANVRNNLAAINIEQHQYKNALQYTLTALQAFKEINHKHGEAHATVFIGLCYSGLGEYAKALEQFLLAIKLLKQTDHKPIEAYAYKGLGDVYIKLEAYNEALKHFKKALLISEEIEDYLEMCDMHAEISKIYHRMGKPHEALERIKTGKSLAEKHNLPLKLQALQALEQQLLDTL